PRRSITMSGSDKARLDPRSELAARMTSLSWRWAFKEGNARRPTPLARLDAPATPLAALWSVRPAASVMGTPAPILPRDRLDPMCPPWTQTSRGPCHDPAGVPVFLRSVVRRPLSVVYRPYKLSGLADNGPLTTDHGPLPCLSKPIPLMLRTVFGKST